MEQVKANLRYPDDVNADNGYYTTEGLLYLAEKEIDGYIPDKNTVIEIKTREVREYKKEEMRYDKEGDHFECQYGRIIFRYMI